MKKIIGILAMLLMISSVSANYCDNVEEGFLDFEDLRTDLNKDGVVNLIDVTIFTTNRDNDTWCAELFESYYKKSNTVSGSRTFQENLDNKNSYSMSRNLPILGESISRYLKFDGVTYRVGFSWAGVKLYNLDKEKMTWPEGLKVTIEPRTFWTRTLVFTRE